MRRAVQLSLIVLGAWDAQAFVHLRRANQQQARSVQVSAQQEATFGMGCFWKPSEELLKVEGVQDTVVGYTGVKNPAGEPPTYDTVCFSRDWVEGVRVFYDDEQVSYPELLNAFFEAQEPKLGSRQYASMIFPHDEQQEELAKQWLQTNDKRIRDDGVPAYITQIEPLTPFYRAENYHQQYWQKTRPRIAALIAIMSVGIGSLDSIVPVELHSQLHTFANGLVLAACLYVTLERKLDTKVVEM